MRLKTLLALAIALVATPALAGPACDAAIAYSTARHGVAVLVLKDGRPVCEDYANGGAPERGHEIWSGTKSFTGIMAAAAVQDGLLTLDEPVSKTITEWKADPAKAKMTIRQMLSLTGGLPGGAGRAPTYADAVATPLINAPGEKFTYGPAPFQIFGEVMKRKLAAAGKPTDPVAWLQARVLDPIGARPNDWRRTADGDPILSQAAIWNAREWAKVGEFVRAGGKVNGKAIVDEQAFAELFKGSKPNPAYGVSWWLPAPSDAGDVVTASLDLGPHAAELPKDLVIAAGAGNQRLYVIPSLGITAVRLATFDPMGGATRNRPASERWSDWAFLKALLVDPGVK